MNITQQRAHNELRNQNQADEFQKNEERNDLEDISEGEE